MLQNIKKSLRTQAIVFALAVGTLPVLAIGTLAYYSANKGFTEKIVQTEKTLITKNLSEINLFMEDRLKDIQAMANLDIFTNSQLRQTTTSAQKSEALQRIQDIYGFYDSIAFFDSRGNPIAQTKGKALDNHLNRLYIQDALKVNGAVISQPLLSSTSGTFSVYSASTIKDKASGQVVGFIRARLPVKILQEILNADRGEDHGATQYYLADNQGNVFVTPEGIQTVQKTSAGKTVQGDEEENQASKVTTLFPGLEKLDLNQGAVTGFSQNSQTNTKQFLVYISSSGLEGYKDLNWSAIIAEDPKELFAAQRQLGWIIFLGTIFTGIVTTGIAATLVNRTTKFLSNIANNIASSSLEIASTVDQQERTITNQASSVSQTTTTMDELGSASLKSAEQAEASNRGATQAFEIAEEGTQSVQQAITGINTLKDQVNAIAEQIMRLSEQTGQIVNISKLVKDIANQTNMLALNAAVEAVRAGEQGKGFSVVASEIRKLADESKKSADNISSLANEIQASMNSTVMVTDEGTKRAVESIDLAENMANAFAGVKEAVNNVVVNSQQISLSAKQQAVAVQEVISAMNEINLGAQETASGIKQVKSSTHQLTQAAQELNSMV